MAVFARAPIVDGAIVLNPGNYFIDTPSAKWVAAMEPLAKLLPNTAFWEQLPSGRGQMMVSFKISRGVVVPRSIALNTGHWYLLPAGVDVKAASTTLYGMTTHEPKNFFDWLVAEHPELTQQFIETVEDVEEVINRPDYRSLLIGGGMMVLGFALLKSRR